MKLTCFIYTLFLISMPCILEASDLTVVTTADLRNACKNLSSSANLQHIGTKDKVLGLACFDYMQGIQDSIQVYSTLHSSSICLPEKLTLQQQIDAFLTWTDKRPELWSERKSFGVFMALMHLFPCSKKKE